MRFGFLVLFVAGAAFAQKQPIHGLVSMGSEAFSSKPGSLPNNSMEEINAHPAIYSGAVINLLWSQLEPQKGVFDDSAITGALANIAAYNAKYPATPVVAKLRVHAGIGTPVWIPQLTGGPITIGSGASSYQIGTFWSAPYRTEWQALQAHLAAQFDSSAAVAEVAISSCSSSTAEPFIAPLDTANLFAMRQFGFSDATYMACLSWAKDDYAAWVNTPLDYTFNSFRNSDGCVSAKDTGCIVENPGFTNQVMDAFRAALGTSRSVVANHGLQDTLKAVANPIYSEFQNLYAQAQAQLPPSASPLELQTISQTVNWDSSIQFALSFHPTEIEIWDTVAAGGAANLSTMQLQSYASQLQANNAVASGLRLVSAANPLTSVVAAGSLVSIFGTGLAAASGVNITDSAGSQQQATILYSSATQINLVLPAMLATGLATSTAGSAKASFTVTSVAPGLFSADGSGSGAAAYQTAAAAGNAVYLILYGTGFRNRSSLINTLVSIGSQTAVALYAGAQGGFAGLDQLNVLVPPSAVGTGVVNVSVTVDGVVSNTVTVRI